MLIALIKIYLQSQKPFHTSPWVARLYTVWTLQTSKLEYRPCRGVEEKFDSFWEHERTRVLPPRLPRCSSGVAKTTSRATCSRSSWECRTDCRVTLSCRWSKAGWRCWPSQRRVSWRDARNPRCSRWRRFLSPRRRNFWWSLSVPWRLACWGSSHILSSLFLWTGIGRPWMGRSLECPWSCCSWTWVLCLSNCSRYTWNAIIQS